MQTHPPPPQKWPYLHEYGFYFLNYIVDFIFGDIKIFMCVTDQKNRSKMTKYTGKMGNVLKQIKNQIYEF